MWPVTEGFSLCQSVWNRKVLKTTLVYTNHDKSGGRFVFGDSESMKWLDCWQGLDSLSDMMAPATWFWPGRSQIPCRERPANGSWYIPLRSTSWNGSSVKLQYNTLSIHESHCKVHFWRYSWNSCTAYCFGLRKRNVGRSGDWIHQEEVQGFQILRWSIMLGMLWFWSCRNKSHPD